MKKIFSKIDKYLIYSVLSYLVFVSFFSYLIYSENGKNLIYADAISRLDIARKVIDNITPGLPQVGNVWLPLPQLLMLPFIWNTYLWHSGIAGYIMSGISFILCGIFIYKASFLITKSFLASFFAVLIFSLNINILYLQTTAMSESIFLASLAATIFFFLKWFHTKEKTALMWSAVSVSAMTLIRYEGLAVLLPSIPLVAFYSFVSYKRRFKTAEGNTILYTVLACLGFGLWTLYLAIIFGNPLYWKSYYATPQATGGATVAFTQAKPFIAAMWQYFTSFVWMIGIIPTIMGIAAIPIMLLVCLKRKSWDFLVLLMPFSIFLFMVFTLQRNTPIVQPSLNWNTLMSGTTSEGTGFNIRYGLLLLPWVAVLCSYLLIWKNKFIRPVMFLILVGIFGIQIYSYVVPTYTPIYKIPARIYDKPFAASVKWLQENYDGGKILISAGGHEDQMFATGFNYTTFIHEGTGKYWKESVDNPSRYAKWVVIDYGHNADNVARYMNREDILEREYKLVYQENQLNIWKKYKAPYYEIK